jgi:neutral ceramidase
MKQIFFIRNSVLLCLLISLATVGCATKHDDPIVVNKELRAGVAEIDITPPVGHRMAGYFDERLATGTHDPLHAKAIVMQQGGEQIAMVFCDLVGISLNVSKNARAQASQKTGIPVSHILISATHSHTGPLFDDTRRKYFHELAIQKFGKDPQEKIHYPDFLAERLVKVIAEAQSKLQPAEIDVGIGKQFGLGFNRRYHMKNGMVAFNPGQLNTNIVRAAGPIDPDVGMLLVRDAKRKLRGGLTVFAMHADTVGGTLYSADYAYFLQQTLRKELGRNYISAFAAGTCGDINHINVAVKEPVKGFDVAKRLGGTLGKTVLANLANAKPVQNPSLAARSAKISLALQEITPEQLADAKTKIDKLGDSTAGFFTKVQAVKTLDLAEKGTNWPSEVQVFRLDSDTAIVGLPCEIFVELGLAIKEQSPFKKTIVMSICNDRPSYVPTIKAFKEGSYEISNARVRPGVGEMLVETAVKLLNEAKN